MADIVEDSNNLSNVTQPCQLVLTEEKKYHLFFCHSSEDEKDIRPILELLEDAPYNLTCCISRRDFMLGESVPRNIENALNQSHGTVVFLTPTFLQSKYCRHEVDTAFTMCMEGEGRIIPVILKPCPVPNEFRTIHYIDEDIPERIAERIYTFLNTDPTDIMKNLPLNRILAVLLKEWLEGTKYIPPISVQFICTILGTLLDCYYGVTASLCIFIYKFKDQLIVKCDVLHPLYICSWLCKKVDDVLTAILKVVVYLPINKPHYRKHLKKFLILSPFLMCVVLLSILTVIGSAMRQSISGGDNICSFCIIWAVVVLPAAIFFTACVLVPLTLIYRYVVILRSKKALGKLNQYSLLDKSCCFGLQVSMCSTPVLSVVKYDIDDCKDVWPDIINSKIYRQYFQKLCDETLPDMGEERHIVVKEKVCLCQYLEHSCNIVQTFSSSDVVVVQDRLPLIRQH